MNKKKGLVATNESPLSNEKEYNNLLLELQSILAKGQNKAYKTVDNIKVQTYWQLGERIVREELKNKNRADYGKYLIADLSNDLGFQKQRIYEIVKFYDCYPIVRALHGQLSWYHYLALINIENKQERVFYEKKIIQNSWGYRELRKQIKANLFKNSTQEDIEDTFKNKLPPVDSQTVFRDAYDFQFIDFKDKKSEKQLEDDIIDNFELFLKELGEDFSILGRQVPIKIDGQTHFIDLVLYHRGIPCMVLVDLKIGKLDSRDIGQMNKYIGYYRRNKQYEHEKDTIGLIICKEAGQEEVTYALDGLEKKIFIASYQVKLPSEEKIKEILHKS